MKVSKAEIKKNEKYNLIGIALIGAYFVIRFLVGVVFNVQQNLKKLVCF